MCRRVGKSHTILFLIYPFLLSSLFSLCPASFSHPLLSHLTFWPLLSCSLLINLFLSFLPHRYWLQQWLATQPVLPTDGSQSHTTLTTRYVRICIIRPLFFRPYSSVHPSHSLYVPSHSLFSPSFFHYTPLLCTPLLLTSLTPTLSHAVSSSFLSLFFFRSCLPSLSHGPCH